MRLHMIVRLLICIALALQGGAYAIAPAEPCAMSGGVEDSAAIAHDCCNDADARSVMGKPCKSGQECPVAQALSVSAPTVLPPPPAAGLRPAEALGMRSFDPLMVWRPPILS